MLTCFTFHCQWTWRSIQGVRWTGHSLCLCAFFSPYTYGFQFHYKFLLLQIQLKSTSSRSRSSSWGTEN